MAESIQLGIVVDTDTRATRTEFSSLRREVKKEADAMGGDWEAAAQKVEDALIEAGARTDLIDAAKKIGTDGPTEIEKMQKALKDTGEDAKVVGDDVSAAADQISQSFEDNALTADDVLGAEVKGEVLANATEVGAEVVRGLKDGFDSEDLGTVVDGVTDTIVSIGALGGPVGIAAGIAGGAVIQAFAGPFIEEAEKNAERAKEVYTTAFDAIVEAGAEKGRELTIQAQTDALVQDTEKLAEAQQIATSTGADLAVVIRALSGDEEAYNLVKRDAAETQSALNEELDKTPVSGDNASGSLVNLNEEYRNLIGEQSTLDESLGTLGESFGIVDKNVQDATESARAKADVDAYATEQAILSAAALATQSGKAQDLEVKIDGVSESIRVMPGGKVVKVTDEGTAEETKEKIGSIKGGKVTMTVGVDQQSITNARAAIYNGVGTITVPVKVEGAGRIGVFYE
jgi:hypothetical protein